MRPLRPSRPFLACPAGRIPLSCFPRSRLRSASGWSDDRGPRSQSCGARSRDSRRCHLCESRRLVDSDRRRQRCLRYRSDRFREVVRGRFRLRELLRGASRIGGRIVGTGGLHVGNALAVRFGSRAGRTRCCDMRRMTRRLSRYPVPKAVGSSTNDARPRDLSNLRAVGIRAIVAAAALVCGLATAGSDAGQDVETFTREKPPCRLAPLSQRQVLDAARTELGESFFSPPDMPARPFRIRERGCVYEVEYVIRSVRDRWLSFDVPDGTSSILVAKTSACFSP